MRGIPVKPLVLGLLFCCLASAADLGGRWSTGRGSIFTFQVEGERFSGIIEGRPGERSYKIVDGTLHGSEISFSVLHDAKDDPEVIENGGKPFRNTAAGAVAGDEITVSGAREGTNQRAYKLVLKRIPGGQMEVIELRPNFHVIAGAGANVSVQSGPDGVILVDAGSGALSDQVLSAVKMLSARPVRFVIDTSADADHVGGNAKIAAGGESLTPVNLSLLATGATILAHENVLDRMSAPSGKQSPFPSDAWPTETFARNQKSMFLNHEGIQIMFQPAAHSDGDSMVFFRRSDVIAAGDLIDAEHFPVIDVERGGSIQGEIDALNRLVEMAIPSTPLLGQDPGTYVVPGHGHILEQADVVSYRDMVTIVRDVVQHLMGKGQTLEQIKQAAPTKGYSTRYGGSGPASADAFVESIYNSLSKKK